MNKIRKLSSITKNDKLTWLLNGNKRVNEYILSVD